MPGSGPLVGGFASGAGYVLRGFGLWRHRPGLMALGMLPALLVFAVLATAFVALVTNLGDLVDWVTPFADEWGTTFRRLLRLGLAVLLVLGALLFSVATFTGLTLIVGEPFYERIWHETELMLGGDVPESGLGFWRGARDGVVLILLGLAAAVGVLVVGLLPVVGAVVGVVLGVVVSGQLLAGELVARPLGARGLDRAARAELFATRRALLTGFGITTQLFFLVPLGAIVVMPAAVAGATMLARAVLDSVDPAD